MQNRQYFKCRKWRVTSRALYRRWWRGGATGRALDLWSTGGFMSYSGQKLSNTLWLRLCASVAKQYNLVSAKGRWCSAAGKVTAGLAESNGSLPTGGWFIVTCGLTACTLGSTPGPMHGNEYGKPLPFSIQTLQQAVIKTYKNSSGDEIANVLVNDDIAHT